MAVVAVQLLVVVAQVEAVQQAVVHRGEQHRRHAQERQPAVQRVEAGEQLAAVRLHLVHRPHAGQDHAGVQQPVDRLQVAEVTVPDGAHHQRHQHDGGADQEVAEQPPQEHAERGERLVLAFGHGRRLRAAQASYRTLTRSGTPEGGTWRRGS
ncbi:MAG: hypothetical protein ABGY75_11880 [Gemmataceae bacterium]